MVGRLACLCGHHDWQYTINHRVLLCRRCLAGYEDGAASVRSCSFGYAPDSVQFRAYAAVLSATDKFAAGNRRKMASMFGLHDRWFTNLIIDFNDQKLGKKRAQAALDYIESLQAGAK